MMIKGPVFYPVHSLSFEELSFNFEEALIEISSTAHLIDEPKILFVLNRILQNCNMLRAFLIPCIGDQSCYLKLHYSRSVALVVVFWELFHGYISTNRSMAI